MIPTQPNNEYYMPHTMSNKLSISDLIKTNNHNNCLLGLIYYKSLCDKQLQFVKDEELTKEDLSRGAIFEETVDYIQSSLGYYIEQDYLFSSWLAKGYDFNSGCIIDALHGFIRMVKLEHKNTHKVIIESLQMSISTLDIYTPIRTKILSKIIRSIENTQADNEVELYGKIIS